MVYGDTPLVTVNSTGVLQEYVFSAWHNAAYGENFPQPMGYIFYLIVDKLAAFVGTVTVFDFLYRISIPAGFITCYWFLGRFSKNLWVRMVGSALYIINPNTMSIFGAGTDYWPFVFLPLALGCFLDLLESQDRKNVAKLALSTSMVIWTFPSMTVPLFSVFLVVFLSYLALGKARLRRVGPYVALSGVFVAVAFLPYLYVTYIFGQSSAGGGYTSVLADFVYTYFDVSIPNLLRLAGNAGSPMVPLGYESLQNPLNEFGYIIPAIAFSSILWLKDSDSRHRVISMLGSVLFLTVLAILLKYTSSSGFSWVIQQLSLIWQFRNPSKILTLLVLTTVPLFTFALDRVVSAARGSMLARNYKIAILCLLVIFAGVGQLFVYNPHAFSGDMGTGIEYASVSPDHTLESIVEDSLTWSSSSTYRGIILPYDHLTELHVQFVDPFLYPARLGLNSSVLQEIGSALNSGLPISNLLSVLSTKYVYLNYQWKGTVFQMLVPSNLSQIADELTQSGALEDLGDGYVRFTLNNTLPRVYLSDVPVFYSNVGALADMPSSIFNLQPVFLPMGYAIETNGTSALQSSIVRTYSWQTPIGGENYTAYALTYGSTSTASLDYELDGTQIGSAPASGASGGLLPVANFEMSAGSHSLVLWTNGNSSSSELGKTFIGSGSWNTDGGITTVSNGTLLTADNYSDFELSVDVKPVQFGGENWQGPNIYFSFSNGSYVRLIIHDTGVMEIATSQAPNLAFAAALAPAGSWSNIEVLKHGSVIDVYFNGEQVLTYSNPLLGQPGQIGIGSDTSVTQFEHLVISGVAIAGVLLLPAANPADNSAEVVDQGPDYVHLEANSSSSSWAVLFLGENYDGGWEAKLDGVQVGNHQLANTYGNAWILQIPNGTHSIDVDYAPSGVYKVLFYISLSAMIGVVVYLVAGELKGRGVARILGRRDPRLR
ncbi:MAG: family 16 glycoside hydrolase [Conexivisphaerales archaeon]